MRRSNACGTDMVGPSFFFDVVNLVCFANQCGSESVPPNPNGGIMDTKSEGYTLAFVSGNIRKKLGRSFARVCCQ